jgi:hypothetical protein
MTNPNNAPATPEVANLPETRKAQAQARKTHPAGKAAPAKKATPAKQPAKKSPVPASSKLRWQLNGAKDSKGRVAQSAVAGDGATYKISGEGDKWKAVVTVNGKTTVLGDGIGHTRAYTLCVKHHRDALAAAA